MSNDTSVFNPELFLNATVEEAGSTEYVLVPIGVHTGVIEPITSDSFKSFDIKKGENAGKKAYRLDLTIALNDDTGALKEAMGRAPKVRYGIMLDMKPDGTLEMGKGRNVQLNRLREAVGQNLNGRPWSFPMLAGQPVKVEVAHGIWDGKPQTEVKNVTKAY